MQQPRIKKTVFLSTENQLNKILKSQRETGKHIKLLFTSTWKDQNEICLKLREQVVERADNTDLYIIDSCSLPHCFVIFRITKVPALVTLRGERVIVEDYVPHIYENLIEGKQSYRELGV